MRVFFCKYNDPPYVKVEKLDIMVRLAGENNVDTLLSELRECVFFFYFFLESDVLRFSSIRVDGIAPTDMHPKWMWISFAGVSRQ
jgi:hypothetical protein